MGSKQFILAEVKQADSESEAGEFEAILSAPTLDRDQEIIDSGAFEPLPASIPVHAYHDFRDPIGRGVPFYDGDVLKLRGFYASTPRAQEIRTLVAEGVIANMSVGFMSAQRTEDDEGKTHIVRGEILEGSMVSIPSNREAAILMAKDYADQATTKTSGDEPVSKTPDTDPDDAAASDPAEQAPSDAPVKSAEAGAVPASLRAVIAEGQAHTV